MTDKEKTLQSDPIFLDCFAEAFMVSAHTLIYWGYQGALSRITNDTHHETDLTGYIVNSINNKLRSFDSPIWCENFTVKENSPVERKGCEGKKRPMPDIIIEGTIPPRPEFICEAKRLKRPDCSSLNYVGEDGLKCFITGKYASRYSEALMIGYIQSDSPAFWQEDIQKRIENNKEALLLIPPQQPVKIIAEFPDEWKSIHHRETSRQGISIYHILLDFRTN